jgi:hypothetical protein
MGDTGRHEALKKQKEVMGDREKRDNIDNGS